MRNNETTVNFANKKDKIAIVGVACRFPGGVVSLDDYWQVLSQGQDVVTEIPSDRFGTEFYQHPERREPGKSVTFSAGVLDNVDQFDAAFFGISPREAEQMDPQQRLLLELTWEALENGAQVPEQLAGSDCAVYMGIASTDYLNRRVEDPASMDAYTMTGNTASIASNRISYLFDLQGPSVSVDTACSSSLVAIHHACQAIRSGEASMAIAGGVNMLLHPFAFVGFSKASMLSARGRCRTFDASGDGYVRSEGAAVLLLKPLEQAEADGDPIQGVIVASGINADGKTNGMTVPSDQQQGKLLQKLYQQQAIDIDDLVYLEAHGTGTAVGDPIETRAIGEVLAKNRLSKQPLFIGSAKSNLGHLETASGMAGLLKGLLTLQQQLIPPSLHIEQLNPAIDFAALNLQVVTQATPLQRQGSRQLVGVNSFGFGGANAHIIIEAYQATATTNKQDASISASQIPTNCPPLFLSAQSEPALRALAARYADYLAHDSTINVYDVAWNALYRRQHLTEGLLIQANDRAQLRSILETFASQNEMPKQAVTGRLLAKNTPLVLVFSGNGSQWQGMGQVLLQANPVFRQAIAEVDALFAQYADYSLLDEFAASPEASRLDLTEVAQPLLFAMQVAMVRVLQTEGAQINAVVGHSVGEVAAAWTVGALSLEQAVRVIYERSHAQGQTKGQGRMAAISLSPDALQEYLAPLNLQDRIEIAGINSPNAVTVSARLEDLETLQARLKEADVFCRILDLDYAFHSHWMEPTKETLLQALQDLKPATTHNGIRFISTVSGREEPSTALDAQYWWDNIRQPVAFATAMDSLIKEGARVFMEIGPHAILRGYISDCLRTRQLDGLVLATGKRKEQADCLQKALQRAWLAGCSLDWSHHFPQQGAYVSLPNYPWQRERYWYPLTTEGYDLVNRQREHPLLGYRLKDAEATWENQLDAIQQAWLADHVVDGAVIVPGAAYVEMALAASRVFFKAPSHALEYIEIQAPIMLEAGQSKAIRFTLQAQEGGFTISSRDRLSSDAWTVNVVGRITSPVWKTAAEVAVPNLQVLKAQAAEVLQSGQHYELTAAVGLSYKAAFQGVKQVWAHTDSALAELQVATTIQADMDAYDLHPALLDAAFQVLVAIFRDDIRQGQLTALIPIQLGKLNFFGGRPQYVHAQIQRQSPRSVVADFLLLNEAGQVVAELQHCRFRGVQFARARQRDPAAYEFVAVPKPLLPNTLPTPCVEQAVLNQPVNELLQTREVELQRQRHFDEVMPLLDALATACAWEALQALQAETQAGICLSTASQQYGIVTEQLPLLQQLLAWLEEDGLATATEHNVWHLADNSDLPPAQAIWLAILGDSPAHLPELTLLGRSGQHLLAILRGEMQAEAILAPEKSSIQAHWQDSAPSFRSINIALAQRLKTLVAQWPTTERLRILELGGGDAVLTQRLLPLVAALPCDYVFSDGDSVKVTQAQDVFADYDGFTAITLADEFTGDNYKQLLQQEHFDVVIAGNALMDWRKAVQRLPRLRQLMKPQAQLWLAQTQESRFLNLIQGIQATWWVGVQSTKDTQQYVARLWQPQEWQDLLSTAGFEQATAWFEPADADTQAGAYLVSAQNQAQSNVSKPIIQSASWLIIADETGFSADVARHLQMGLQAQDQAVKVQTTPTWEADFEHVIYLAGLQAGGEMPSAVALMDLQAERCINAMSLVQAIDQAAAAPQLCLVTAHAMPAANAEQTTVIKPEQAPLWGLGRVLMNEHANMAVRLLDWQGTWDAATASAELLRECLYKDAEDEVLLSESGRYALRLQQTQVSSKANSEQQAPAVCLDFTSPGPLKHLYWRALPEQALQEDEIEIHPHATGLNFRDVMYAMGLLSDEAVENGFAGASLGMELSGEVVRTGAAVKDFKAGDAVIGFAPACFSTRVITRTTAVAHKPPEWTDEEAATVPTTFFTVYYALNHLAQLQPGERILIHGASGGVGLAAIQFARYRGAEVFATAGTDEKREFVRLMGADHVLDSRSLKFAEDIMRLTAGEGVDIVLNSISGEAINKNLAILRPFGRFLELGKRDFYENSRVGLRPFRNNISYFGIDADQLLIERPVLAGRLFREMMALFQQEVLRPLPYRAFPATRVHEAFRYMQQSRQIGKVVVSFSGNTLSPSYVDTPTTPLQLHQEGSYLVTGGLSGFGLRTAQWLANKGAGTLVLVGRSGANSPEAQQAITSLQKRGVRVIVYTCDVSDTTAVQAMMTAIKQDLPPLRGVVHAAMVLEDGLLRNLTPDAFRKVLAPKLAGAWNLHQFSQDCALDLFVMYSSVTTYLGNPGQANYVAANLFLESLAHARQAQGLPAVYAAWGAIADAGYLARQEEVREALQSRLGGEALSAERALAVLEKLIHSNKVGAAFVDFDWRTIQRVMPGARSPKFVQQRRLARGSDDDKQGDDIQALLVGLDEEAAHTLIVEKLMAEVGQILRLPREKLAADKSVFDLGMDSLMGMELVLAIEERFKVRLPVMALTEGATISRIAAKIVAQLQPENSVIMPADERKQSIAAVVNKHGSAMSDAERAALMDNLSADKTEE